MEAPFISRQSLAVRTETPAVSGFRASVHKAALAWLKSKQTKSNHLSLPAVDNSAASLSRSTSFRSSSFRGSSFRESSFRTDVLEGSYLYDDELAFCPESLPIQEFALVPTPSKKKRSMLAKAVRNLSKLGRRKAKSPDLPGSPGCNSSTRIAASEGAGRGEGFQESSVSRKAASVAVSGLAGYGVAMGIERLNKQEPVVDGDFSDVVDPGTSNGDDGGVSGGRGSSGDGGGDGFGDHGNKSEGFNDVIGSGDDEQENQQQEGRQMTNFQLAGPFASVNQSSFQSYPSSPPNGLPSQPEKLRQSIRQYVPEEESPNEHTDVSIDLASLGPAASEVKLPTTPPQAELEIHPGGAFSAFPDHSEMSHNLDAIGPPVSELKLPSQSPGADLEVHPGGSAGKQELKQEKGDFFEWVAGFMNSFSLSSKGGKGGNYIAPREYNEGERELIVEQTAAQVMKLIFESSGDEALAKRAETGALRRLQRETFSDLLKIRERLDKLELHTGLRGSKNFGSSSGLAKTRLTGQVHAGAAMVLMKDSSSRESRAALEQSGMLTGLDVKFKFETSFREKDKLVTECVTGQGTEAGPGGAFGGPLSLRKVAYTAEINDRVTVTVAPLGGDNNDMLQPVNPVQDIGLTSFSSNGPALHNHCNGSGIGAAFKGMRSVWSISQYVRGWENSFSNFDSADTGAPLCLSTFAQVTAVPTDFMAFSLLASNRYWPSPPLPSDHSLHWGEMGPLVLSKTHSSVSSTTPRTSNGSFANGQLVNWSTSELDTGGLDSQGTAMQSLAFSGEAEIGPLNLGGWAQVDRGDWESDNNQLQWAISIAKSAGARVGGGLTIGQSRPDFWSLSRGDEETFSSETGHAQLQVEAFLRVNCGQGFVVQPGLLYVLNKQAQTPAIMLKSSWSL